MTLSTFDQITTNKAILNQSISLPIETTTSASITLDTTNHTILCDCTSNNITVNLPQTSTASGVLYYIKKIDSSSNTITIDGSTSETIDGETTITLSSQYDSLTIQCDGSAWYII
jgi:hypothetical protein